MCNAIGAKQLCSTSQIQTRSAEDVHLPEYLGSSLSSFRNRALISGDISSTGDAFSSAPSLLPASSFPWSSLPPAASLSSAAFSFGRGVPVRLGWSSSSPMTNSGSNSEGSGPLPVMAALLEPSPSLPLSGRFEGDRLRELDRFGVDPDRDRVAWAEARCFACSSAMRASRAPLMRLSLWLAVNRNQDILSYLEALKHVCNILHVQI